ncbi:hypothetical protein [Cellulomonas sp. C5510]|uniref:hypothetical protein n=1 Tax=Cellulomonas sp. C5510 TaxID=2871170 RepID=UPI001C94EC8E|nr:hypothetical protein [Cellulomonas sp. C5510]QZN85307.1 hypothetical protein K5O09_16290 [Cellulomonas sp. C5510]
MTPPPALRRLTAAAALACVTTLGAAGPALAASQVDVADQDGGPAVLDPAAATTLRVSGTGFQSVPGGFGGLYVLFGWVDPAAGDGWRPSAGGASGVQYRYAVDAQSQENAGYQRFVAFPGSRTSAEANGGQLAEDGTWATELTVPGPVLETLGADGGTVEVDCREVTCGVITIGAHGVANATNETFTPVPSAASGAAATTGADAVAPADPAAAPTATAPAPTPGHGSTTPSADAVAAPEPSDPGAAVPWPAVVAGGLAAVAAVGLVALRRRASGRTATDDVGDGDAPDQH